MRCASASSAAISSGASPSSQRRQIASAVRLKANRRWRRSSSNTIPPAQPIRVARATRIGCAGGMVLLDDRRQRLFAFNRTADAIWRLWDDGLAPDEIAALLADAHRIAPHADKAAEHRRASCRERGGKYV